MQDLFKTEVVLYLGDGAVILFVVDELPCLDGVEPDAIIHPTGDAPAKFIILNTEFLVL